jgi:hypothetical protein
LGRSDAETLLKFAQLGYYLVKSAADFMEDLPHAGMNYPLKRIIVQIVLDSPPTLVQIAEGIRALFGTGLERTQ